MGADDGQRKEYINNVALFEIFHWLEITKVSGEISSKSPARFQCSRYIHHKILNIHHKIFEYTSQDFEHTSQDY